MKDDMAMVNNTSHRVAELVLCITMGYKLKRLQVSPPTYKQENTNSFHIDEHGTLEIPNDDVPEEGASSACVGKQINPMERATRR